MSIKEAFAENHRMRIRGKMITAILIITILAVTISIFSVFRISRETLQKNYIKMAEDRLDAFDLLVDKELRNQISVIRQYMLSDSLMEEIQRVPQSENEHYYESYIRVRLASQISQMFNQLSNAEGVFLFDNYDRYYMYLPKSTDNMPYLKYYREDLDKMAAWYQLVQKSKGREIFWNADVLNPENKECFSIIKKLRDTSAYEEQGIVIVTMEKSLLTRLYSQLNSENITMLMDEQEEYMLPIGGSDENEMEEFYLSYRNQMEGDPGDYLFLEKRDRLTGWKFITGIRKNELYAEGKYLESYVLILLPVVLIAVIVFSFLVASNIYKPLQKLKDAVEEINSGNRQITTEFDHDEIGEIGNTIKRVINNNLLLEKKLVDVELAKKNSQYLLLQAQINPHYLYNTLDSIYVLTLKYKVEDIGNMVLALSEMFRMSLNDGKGYVQVSDELKYIENYMSVLKYRFHDRFTILYDVEDSMESLYMLKLVLQPFVENAIIHGLEPKVGNGSVILSGDLKDQMMIFRIYDNGTGFDVEEKMLSGYGIRNVMERVKLIYGDEAEIKVKSTIGEGTTVVLKIPVKEREFFLKYEEES